MFQMFLNGSNKEVLGFQHRATELDIEFIMCVFETMHVLLYHTQTYGGLIDWLLLNVPQTAMVILGHFRFLKVESLRTGISPLLFSDCLVK